MRLYEPVTGSGGTLYAETKSHKLPVVDVTPGVVHLALSPSEEHIAVMTSNCNILQLNLTHADVKEDVTFGPVRACVRACVLVCACACVLPCVLPCVCECVALCAQVGVWSHGPVMGTHVVSSATSFRPPPCAINGLDVAVRKPLLVTCGVDCTVRLWNYSTKVQELVKSFPEEPHSVAIHPSGHHVVVGFADKLRFMNVLMDDIRMVKEMGVKAAREVRFSHGGAMFAVASGNFIVVYATYTCDPVATLR